MKVPVVLALLWFGQLASLVAAPLHLEFRPMVDGKRMLQDSLRYENGEGETFSVTRMDWLASGFQLVMDDGRVIGYPGKVAWIPTRGGHVSFPDTPPGSLRALRFYVGLDKVTNHADPGDYDAHHPLNPNRNNLHWNWQGGFIFFALEGHWRSTDDEMPDGYAYHFARDPNRTLIEIPVNLPLQNESRLLIGVDPQQVLKRLSFKRDGMTTHANEGDPIPAKMKAALPQAFALQGVNKGGVPVGERKAPIDMPAKPTPYRFTLPAKTPLPPLPTDNPLIHERVALGKALFNDPMLSRDKSMSCATCHQTSSAFSDPRKFSIGVNGAKGVRHSMPLFNLAWKNAFFWDGRSPSLREQVLSPIQDHKEMASDMNELIERLSKSPRYPEMFKQAFGSGEVNSDTIGLALENFLLTLVSLDSRFDRVMRGQATFTTQEKRGFELFFTEYEPRTGRKGADCFHCHGGTFFTDHSFHNNGLKPTGDKGLMIHSKKPADMYKFSTPSLRNISLSAPFMHDGRFDTLRGVIQHYNAGGEVTETLDPNLAKHKEGLGLSDKDIDALVEFLKTLSDPLYQQR